MSTFADRERLRLYYAQGREWGRLDDDSGWLERERTLALIERHVPKDAHVLDLGGGPGRYTLALAEGGYRATLVDLSPELIDEAKRRIAASPGRGQVVGAFVGDALRLEDTLGAACVDAVLCYGPLYHCASAEECGAMLAQVARVLRPGGVALCAFMPRATGIAGLIARAASSPEQVTDGALEAAWQTGRFVNAEARAFGEVWFMDPEALEAKARAQGLIPEETVSLRGLAASCCGAVRALARDQPERLREVMALIDATAARPDVIGMGGHAVCVARKP